MASLPFRACPKRSAGLRCGSENPLPHQVRIPTGSAQAVFRWASPYWLGPVRRVNAPLEPVGRPGADPVGGGCGGPVGALRLTHSALTELMRPAAAQVHNSTGWG